MNKEMVFSELEKNGVRYACNFCVKEYSTFRIGGNCAVAIFPNNVEELVLSVRLLDSVRMPFSVVGKGSNTLFSDSYIERALIFTSGASNTKMQDNNIYAEAGASLVKLCRMLAEHGLGGAEFACGIPASIGGAVYMNAGAHGGTVADIIEYTDAYDRSSGETVRIYDNNFGYRKSIYSQNSNLVCLGALFKLYPENTETIKETMSELLQKRKSSQPLEYPSAGSYFKRPEGDFAGRLIEVSGLKGVSVGGAEVSEKHAGFIINKGGACFDDVMRLEELVKNTVYEKCDVMLCREVEVIE